MAVVKADAYGHGVVPCTRTLLDAGANSFGVGILSEGIELREQGIEAPIHVLVGVFPHEADDLIRHNLTTTLYTQELAKTLSQSASRVNKSVGIHIKVDTGMGRLGVRPENLKNLLDFIQTTKVLKVESIFTHLSSADTEDEEYCLYQLKRFNEGLKIFKKENFQGIVHCANSAALLRFPESHFDLVRPGMILYGALPDPYLKEASQNFLSGIPGHSFQPVMQWKSRILHINSLPRGASLSYGRSFVTTRESRIATLPVGYGDGLFRNLSNNMDVLIQGKRAKQVGTICMDLCLVDVTDIPEAAAEDEVVLIGNQGQDSIPVEEMALKAGTIPYEIVCGVSKRVPRVVIP